MEGQNPNLPVGRHSWPNHRDTGQSSVTSHFPNAYLGPHLLLLPLPYLLILFKTPSHFHANQNGARLFLSYQQLLNKMFSLL